MSIKMKTGFRAICLVFLWIIFAGRISAASPSACFAVLNNGAEAELHAQNYLYFKHQSDFSYLQQIVESKALYSNLVQKRIHGSSHQTFGGSPQHQVFVSVVHRSHTEIEPAQNRYYGSEDRSLAIRFPLSLINHKNFQHFSVSWLYGDFIAGKSFSREEIQEGLKVIAHNPKNEFVFADELPFELKDIQVEVSPKNRQSALEILNRIDSTIKWDERVISPVERWPDPREIPLETWLTIKGKDWAIKDLLNIDPDDAFQVSIFLIRNIRRWIDDDGQVRNLITRIVFDRDIKTATQFLIQMMSDQSSDTNAFQGLLRTSFFLAAKSRFLKQNLSPETLEAKAMLVAAIPSFPAARQIHFQEFLNHD